MKQRDIVLVEPAHVPNRARLDIRIGKRGRVSAEVAVTNLGLLSIGGLVSSILLSTAILIRAAEKKRQDPAIR